MSKLTSYQDESEITSVQLIGGSVKTTAPMITKATRWLAFGAVAGPTLFSLAWFILGFVSPGFTIFNTLVAPYSPVSHPISGLGLGITAPYMNTAFILSGILIVVGVFGVFQSIREMSPAGRWSSIVLLSLTGIGMILAGLFNLEKILLHTVGFLLGTGAPVLGFLVTGIIFRRIPRLKRFGNMLIPASPLTLVLLVLSLASFDQAAMQAGTGTAGLLQRILILEVHAWFVAVGWIVFRDSR